MPYHNCPPAECFYDLVCEEYEENMWNEDEEEDGQVLPQIEGGQQAILSEQPPEVDPSINQLEVQADSEYDPLPPFIEEMLAENHPDITWNPDDEEYQGEFSCGPGYHGYCVVHEGDLQLCRDYFSSDPDRRDDDKVYPPEEKQTRDCLKSMERYD